jgi:hypothetical protein
METRSKALDLVREGKEHEEKFQDRLLRCPRDDDQVMRRAFASFSTPS